MSGVPFGAGYASAYDVLYGDKDYEAEVDILETLFARHASLAVTSVLDLGACREIVSREISDRVPKAALRSSPAAGCS